MALRVAICLFVVLAPISWAQGGSDPYLGIAIDPHPLLAGKGLLVVRVDEGSSAEAGGLRAGDVIVRAGARGIGSAEALVAALREARAGRELGLEVVRGGEPLALSIPLAGRPAEPIAGEWVRVPDAITVEGVQEALERLAGAFAAGDLGALAGPAATLRAMVAILTVGGVDGETAERLRRVRGEAEVYLLFASSGIRVPVNPLGEPSDLEARLERLIEELGDDSFEVREAAAKALRELGPLARGHLAKATRHADREVAWRAQGILEAIGEGGESGDRGRYRPCVVEVVSVDGDRIAFATRGGEIPATRATVDAALVREGREVGRIRLGELGAGSARRLEGAEPAAGDRIVWTFFGREEDR